MNTCPGGGQMIGRNVNGEFIPLEDCVKRGVMTQADYEKIVKANLVAATDKTPYERDC